MSKHAIRTARRTARVRRSVRAQSAHGRARLSVFRSSKHIYAQLIDDDKGHTVAAAGSRRAGGAATLADRTRGGVSCPARRLAVDLPAAWRRRARRTRARTSGCVAEAQAREGFGGVGGTGALPPGSRPRQGGQRQAFTATGRNARFVSDAVRALRPHARRRRPLEHRQHHGQRGRHGYDHRPRPDRRPAPGAV